METRLVASQDDIFRRAENKIYMRDAAGEHFDSIAGGYDFWKQKNYFYQENLHQLFSSFIPPAKRVLDIGCGTGDMLVSLKPSRGVGIDISQEMVARAQEKYTRFAHISFESSDLRERSLPLPESDFVIMIDVLEHLSDTPVFLRQLHKLLPGNPTLIVSVANPLWEPILWLAEKLHQKMPEGPHERLSLAKINKIFTEGGFLIKERGYRMLVPKNVWGARWINARFYKNRIFARLGFITYWVLQKNG